METLMSYNSWNGNGNIEGLIPVMGMETLMAYNSWNGNGNVEGLSPV